MESDFISRYGRILNRIFSDDRPAYQRTAKMLLSWLVCATRPLKWKEIQVAVSIDVEAQTVDIERRHLAVSAKDLCASLIEETAQEEVLLVHSTAGKLVWMRP